MTQEQIITRMHHLADQENAGPQRLWWLSFCDPKLPKGMQFLGVAIVRAGGITTASAAAHLLGCNPGGEVQGCELPEHVLIPDGYLDRLLTKVEVSALEKQMASAR